MAGDISNGEYVRDRRPAECIHIHPVAAFHADGLQWPCFGHNADPDNYGIRGKDFAVREPDAISAVLVIRDGFDLLLEPHNYPMTAMLMSDKLPARVNIWGEPIKRGDALGPDILSPLYSSRNRTDKTLSEVARLRLGLSKPERSVGDVRLSPSQYAGLVRDSGEPAKAMLDRLTASPLYDGLPDGPKRLLMKRIVELNRKNANQSLLLSNPDLLRAQAEAKVRRRIGER